MKNLFYFIVACFAFFSCTKNELDYEMTTNVPEYSEITLHYGVCQPYVGTMTRASGSTASEIYDNIYNHFIVTGKILGDSISLKFTNVETQAQISYNLRKNNNKSTKIIVPTGTYNVDGYIGAEINYSGEKGKLHIQMKNLEVKKLNDDITLTGSFDDSALAFSNNEFTWFAYKSSLYKYIDYESKSFKEIDKSTYTEVEPAKYYLFIKSGDKPTTKPSYIEGSTKYEFEPLYNKYYCFIDNGSSLSFGSNDDNKMSNGFGEDE